MSSLTDIAKPYVGLYECKELTLNGEDAVEGYKKISLELDAEGRFTLYYRAEDGRKGEYSGHYKIDTENEEITFYTYASRRSRTFVFPMSKGSIYIEYNLGGRMLHGVFSMP